VRYGCRPFYFHEGKDAAQHLTQWKKRGESDVETESGLQKERTNQMAILIVSPLFVQMNPGGFPNPEVSSRTLLANHPM